MRSTFKVLFYLKKDKHKVQPVVPVMGRITVNGTIAQFSAKLSVPPHLWEVKGGRAKGKSLEADRINRYLDNIRIQIGKHYQSICDLRNVSGSLTLSTQLNFYRNRRISQRLRIGITKNKTDTTYTLMVHMVHGIAATSAYTDYFNDFR